MTDREWLLGIRQLLLAAVDLIERRLGLERTSELRRLRKGAQREPASDLLTQN